MFASLTDLSKCLIVSVLAVNSGKTLAGMKLLPFANIGTLFI